MNNENTYNHQGYAFNAARRAYSKMRSWDWGHYAYKHGFMPEAEAYYKEFMLMYNRRSQLIDTSDLAQVAELVDEMVQYFSTVYYEDVQGTWGKRRLPDGGFEKYSKRYDDDAEAVMLVMPTNEVGYRLIEDSMTVKPKLRLLLDKLDDTEVAMLEAMIEGCSTWSEAARELGLDRKEYDRARRRIVYFGKQVFSG